MYRSQRSTGSSTCMSLSKTLNPSFMPGPPRREEYCNGGVAGGLDVQVAASDDRMRSIREVKREVLSAADRHSEKSHALISRTAMRIVESRERMERAKSLAASTHASPALLQGIFVSRGSAPAFSTLREFTLRYLRERDLHRLLDDTLTAVMVATRADRGNVQMLEARTRTLRIVAQRGFEADFLEFFA